MALHAINAVEETISALALIENGLPQKQGSFAVHRGCALLRAGLACAVNDGRPDGWHPFFARFRRTSR